MSNELYYRGSSSYEVAVKNRLSALEAQGAMTTHAIQDMSAEVNGAIRQSTYTILASQQALARTFAHGFNALNNTLMIGFDVMGAKLDAMSEAICSKLDAIHDILNNPLLTASRELYRRALTNYQKGYFEEALEDCKAAVEKNKTDFISWTLLGQIYLFGAGKFSNVIDLDKAEESFFTAAKYIDADIGHSNEANRLASEIYYYLGYTKLIKSNDLLVANNAEESNTKLIEAENSSKRAFSISKENLIAGYEQAKELHFLGNDGEAMRILEELIRADKNYALKASCDKNFESLWGKIDELIERLKNELEEKIKARYEELKTIVQPEINSLNSKSLEIQQAASGIKLADIFDSHAVLVDAALGEECQNIRKSIQSKRISLDDPLAHDLMRRKMELGLKSNEEIIEILQKIVYEIKSTFESKAEQSENALGKDYFTIREVSELMEEFLSTFTEKVHSVSEAVTAMVSEIERVKTEKKSNIEAGEKYKNEEISKTRKIFVPLALLVVFLEIIFAVKTGESFDDTPGFYWLLGLDAFVGGFCIGCSGIIGVILAVISAVIMFLTGHPVIAVVNILWGGFAFWKRNSSLTEDF